MVYMIDDVHLVLPSGLRFFSPIRSAIGTGAVVCLSVCLSVTMCVVALRVK